MRWIYLVVQWHGNRKGRGKNFKFKKFCKVRENLLDKVIYIERSSVKSCYQNRKVKQQWRRWRRRRQRRQERQKKQQIYISNSITYCMYITVFCTLLSHHCMTGTWNFLISCSGFKERNNFLFLFLNLDTVLLDLTLEKFANIWQIKWNWTRSLKSETVWIQFLSDIFG